MMTDVIFYTNYTPDADKVVMVICAVIFLLLNTSYIKKSESLTTFKISNHFLFISAFCSIYYHYLIADLRPEYVYLVYIMYYVTYLALAAVDVSFIVYIIQLCDIQGLERKVLIAYAAVVDVVFVIFLFLPLLIIMQLRQVR